MGFEESSLFNCLSYSLTSLEVRLFLLLGSNLKMFSLTWFSNDSIKVLMVWWVVGVWCCQLFVGLWAKAYCFIIIV